MATFEMQTDNASFNRGLDRGDELLIDNGYPGRWLAVGRGDGPYEEDFFMAYSFGGRSDPSKDRTAILEGNAVRLVAPGMTAEKMAEVPDAALIYYHSSDSKEGAFVVSNGAQTRHVLDAAVEGASLEEAITSAPTVKGMMDAKEIDIDLSSYEPDKIHTPRITGLVNLRDDATTSFGLAVVRRDTANNEPIRTIYTAKLDSLEPGQGWAIQTYGVNDPDDTETPVPYFDQEPYGFLIIGEPAEIAISVHRAIGDRTFAAAVVRIIDTSLRQFNGHAFDNTRG